VEFTDDVALLQQDSTRDIKSWITSTEY